MKTKELQAKSANFRRRFYALISLLILSFVFLPIIASANTSSEDFSAENHKLIEDRLADIGRAISKYKQDDPTSTKSISTEVTNVISKYRNELSALNGHEDSSKRSMTSEIEQAYARSISAGRLAWIYFLNIKDISEPSSINDVKAVYENALWEIEKDMSAESIQSRCSDLCSDLNRAAYTEKISLLLREGDSQLCHGHVEIALGKLVNIESDDSWGGDFTLVFEEAKSELTLQRARDSLYSQAVDIFSVIRPDEDIKTNGRIGMFDIQLKNSKSISIMNEEMRTLIDDLTKPSSKNKYTNIFISRLLISVSELSTNATAADEAGDFVSLFGGYTLSYEKAHAKDEILSLLFDGGSDSELERIEAVFNGDGCIIDGCNISSEIKAEIKRADYEKKLYSALCGALSDINIILGSYDSTLLISRLKDCYDNSFVSLSVLSNSSAQFDENCNKALDKALGEMGDIIQEAKAQRYLLTHSAIIKKSKDELKKEDETALRIAITDYLKLETDVASTISNQINSILEKYKTVLGISIRSFLANDSFYLDLCEIIIDELKSIPVNNVGDFYNSCDIILSKADILSKAVSYYRQLCSAELYKSYTDEEKLSLSQVCKSTASKLGDLGVLSSTAHAEVLITTIVDFDRIDQCVRVRVCARGSENVNIQKLLSDVKATIFLCTDRNEMIAIADKAIFKINRLLTVDTIITRSDECDYLIKKMKFLSSEQKEAYTSRIENLKKALTEEATLAQNVTVLDFVWSSFTEELSSIRKSAEETDLKKSQTEYSALIIKDREKFQSELNAMAHLSAARKKELLDSAVALCAKFTADIQSCESSEKVAQAYATVLEQLHSLELTASSENLGIYKTVISDELDKLCPSKENYSPDNYAKILDIISKAKEKLSSCVSVSECTALLDSTAKNIEGTSDLLDDAKASALKALNDALKLCTDNTSLYSADNIALAKKLYADAEQALNQYKEISDIPKLNETLAQSLKLIRGVRRDTLYTLNEAAAIGSPKAEYPLGYDFSLGYWGRVYSKNGILSGAALSICESEDDLKTLQKLIRKAAKSDGITIYGELSAKERKLLKKCVVALGLDISLSEIADDAKSYTLQMLLPPSCKDENVIGIAFVGEDGKVEFYSIEQKDMLISLNTSHFSKYYILCEETVDLTPLLIFLIILLVFEIIIFCFVLFLRYNRRRKEKNMLPESFLYSLNPIWAYTALRIKPSNAVELSVLLSVAALALGCGIAFLARTELSFLKKHKGGSISIRHTNDSQTSLDEARKAMLRSKTSESELLPEGQEVPVLCGASAHSESDIEAFVLHNDYPQDDKEAAPKLKEAQQASHRAEINLDVIAEKFRYGELVTVEALKKKRLVSKKADYVKILARGTLTKPLIIEAHDFSRAAEEMLIAVGGEAIRI